MRTLLLTFVLLATFYSVSRAQFPALPDSGYSDGVTYLDAGIGTYGFEVSATGEPVGQWGSSLFLRWYPGSKWSFYTLDSNFLGGAKIKYYGWFPEGFYSGAMAGVEVFESLRPWAGATLGYDFFSRFSERSEYKNIHAGFEIQAGVDTEGDGFIGVGVRFGIGFLSDDRPFGDH